MFNFSINPILLGILTFFVVIRSVFFMKDEMTRSHWLIPGVSVGILTIIMVHAWMDI